MMQLVHIIRSVIKFDSLEWSDMYASQKYKYFQKIVRKLAEKDEKQKFKSVCMFWDLFLKKVQSSKF